MGFLYGESNYPAEQDQVSTATSLLVESLQLPDLPGEWEYALTMTGEAFTQMTIDNDLIDISDAAMRIFNVVLYEEERPLGGTITVAANGDISLSQGLIDANMNPFTPVPNSLGSQQSTLPSKATDLNLINIEGPGITSGDFSVTITGTNAPFTVRITQNILPSAAIGCPQTGAPGSAQAPNVWTDSTGVEWCHVAIEGLYSMLISRHTHQIVYTLGSGTGVRNHEVMDFIRWPEATNAGGRNDGPEIRTIVNEWWDESGASANISPQLRGAAVHATLPIYRTYHLQTSPNLAEAMHDETSVALPISGSNAGLPFFLSHADLSVRLTDRRGPTVLNGLWDNDSNIISRSPTGLNRAYWLREPGCLTPGLTSASCAGAITRGPVHNDSASYVSSMGSRTAQIATHTWHGFGFRPAVWIRR